MMGNSRVAERGHRWIYLKYYVSFPFWRPIVVQGASHVRHFVGDDCRTTDVVLMR